MNQNQLGISKQIALLIVGVSVLIFACAVTFAVVSIKNSLLKESEAKISEVTEMAYNVALSYKKKADAGELTLSQAQSMAEQDIRNMKYQGSNYIWVNDFNSVFLIHPTQAKGADGAKLVDKKGNYFIKEITDKARTPEGGFVRYEWAKPGEAANKLYPKLATARALDGWNWVIGTGIYIDEIDKKILQTFLSIFFGNLVAMLLIVVAVQSTFVKKLTATLNSITEGLASSSNQVSEASYHLENASHKLAEGTTEQASSIQEVSATLEETSSMVHKNNENTDQAAILARNAKETAYKSYQEMDRMMTSMNEIKSSSNEISKIIKVIDEIAFQTNILALNAAVEAARAGEAGKGFAVVAEEVRNLAQRSTQSAKDTTELIEKNITLSEQGAELAHGVYDSIAGIDEQAKKVSELLDEISVATNEQALGVEQIHKAIAQMEQVMQSSAQTADETASASQELFAQTSSMNDIVDRMSMIVNGTTVQHQVSYAQRQQLPPAKKARKDVKLLNDSLSDF